jgi:energy-coupling factor transporter ATP-binding protein EcfA2
MSLLTLSRWQFAITVIVIADLSGGERRRLHIARALGARPDVLLIDEPVTGLDALTASRVLATVRQRLPQAVLILAMHELPADTSVLGPGWTVIPLDHNQIFPNGFMVPPPPHHRRVAGEHHIHSA